MSRVTEEHPSHAFFRKVQTRVDLSQERSNNLAETPPTSRGSAVDGPQGGASYKGTLVEVSPACQSWDDPSLFLRDHLNGP